MSSGTYIRSIARDLGRIVGTGAHLASLRRTGIGPLRVREALAVSSEMEPEAIRAAVTTPETIPLPFSTATLGAGEETAFRSGQPSPAPPGLAGSAGDHLRLLTETGRLAGIGEITEEGRVQPRLVLPPAPQLEGLA